MRLRPDLLPLCLLLFTATQTLAAGNIGAEVDRVYPQAESLYFDLHRNPELSSHEQQTAAKLAAGLRELGFDVATGVGGTGVVGVLKNGAGRVVLLRTELDALPVEEKTNLPYASTVHTKDDGGNDVSVMHACGHDVHMSAWLATARIMANSRDRWRGTLVMMGQPAEETLGGAARMIADGLLTRFPRPDFAIAVHDDGRYAAGIIGVHAGPILSNSDSLQVRIFGVGGHGARPETTIDPVVIAARTVLSLQTIVSREISPFDSAVITVGAMHAGTRPNIIPDEATLSLSVRSLNDEVRTHLLGSIDRIVKAEAAAAGATREPLIERVNGASALINDPATAARLAAALGRELGAKRVIDIPPEMASEDFSLLQKAGIPTVMMRVGAVDPSKFDTAGKPVAPLPSLHSPFFAPDRERTIKAAVTAEVFSLRELMGR